jgi:hypothetical protein
MNETLSSTIYAISFLFSLFLIGFLWWLAVRYPSARRFWGWLAVGWSVNTLGSLLWGVVEMFTEWEYPAWIDSLYVARYLFVLLAVWLYPIKLPWRKLFGIIAAMLVAAVILWLGFVVPLGKISDQPQSYILAGTIFPLLDAGMLYACWSRWRDTASSPLQPVFGLFALSTLAYGIANWVNYRLRAVTPEADSLIALLCWFLTDLLAAAAGFYFVKKIIANTKT